MDHFRANALQWFEQNPQYSIIAVIAIMMLGVLLGVGENRKIIVFRTYDDLFITFLVSALFIGGILGLNAQSEDGEVNIFNLLGLFGVIVSTIAFIYVALRTLQSNSYSVWKFLAAMLIKFPLAFFWIFQLFVLLKPRGETGAQRAKSRATALVILTFLTPVVGALAVEKSGFFAPKQILKGKRIGSIRKHL